jgi:hypothetical protein
MSGSWRRPSLHFGKSLYSSSHVTACALPSAAPSFSASCEMFRGPLRTLDPAEPVPRSAQGRGRPPGVCSCPPPYEQRGGRGRSRAVRAGWGRRKQGDETPFRWAPRFRPSPARPFRAERVRAGRFATARLFLTAPGRRGHLTAHGKAVSDAELRKGHDRIDQPGRSACAGPPCQVAVLMTYTITPHRGRGEALLTPCRGGAQATETLKGLVPDDASGSQVKGVQPDLLSSRTHCPI